MPDDFPEGVAGRTIGRMDTLTKAAKLLYERTSAAQHPVPFEHLDEVSQEEYRALARDVTVITIGSWEMTS